MYERTDKRRLYQLIEMYLTGKLDESIFCDDFIHSYDVELDHATLTEEEHQALRELGKVASRFSEFEDDLKKYPGVYFTKEDVRLKILETKERLKSHFDELRDVL